MKRSKHITFLNAFCLTIPAIAGTLACILIISSPASAWFNTNVTYSKHVLVAASFDIETSIEKDNTKLDKTDGTYILDEGTYTISLTRTGESNSNGYALIRIGQDTYHTGDIKIGDTFSFKVTTDVPLDLVITPKWGSNSGEMNYILESGKEIIIDMIPEPNIDENIPIEEEETNG